MDTINISFSPRQKEGIIFPKIGSLCGTVNLIANVSVTKLWISRISR